jgi:hypothetical protein
LYFVKDFSRPNILKIVFLLRKKENAPHISGYKTILDRMAFHSHRTPLSGAKKEPSGVERTHSRHSPGNKSPRDPRL